MNANITKTPSKISPPPIVSVFLWVAAWILLSGGLIYRDELADQKIMLELGQWGFFLIPLILWIYFGKQQKKGRQQWAGRCLLRMFRWIAAERVRLPIILGGITLAYAFGGWQRHLSFRTDWDMAIYANACSGMLHSSLRSHQSILADHFEPLLALLVPACQVVSPILVLIIAQSVFAGIGAFGVYVLSRTLRWSQGFSSGVAALFLLFEGHQQLVLMDFHMYAFALATIPWLAYAFKAERWILFGILALIHATIKESTPLFVVGFGLMLMFEKSHRPRGLVTALCAACFFMVVMNVCIPHFRHGAQSFYFTKLYGHLGGSMPEMISNFFLNPQRFFVLFTDPYRLLYVLKLFMPFLFLPLLRPRIILPILPPILIAVLSSDSYLYSGRFHYEAEIYPWLFCATMILCADARLQKRWKRIEHFWRFTIPPRVVWLWVLIIFFSGRSPLYAWRIFQPSPAQTLFRGSLLREAHALRQCHIAAPERLAPQIAELPEITLLDEWKDANAIMIGWPAGPTTWSVSVDEIESSLIPKWNHDYILSRPLLWDQNFRIWHKAPCVKF